MFALHKAFEESTKSVQDAARAERERRGQLSQQGSANQFVSSPPRLRSIATDLKPRLPSASSSHVAPASLLRAYTGGQEYPPRSPSAEVSIATPTLRSPSSLKPPGPAPTSQLPPVPVTSTLMNRSPSAGLPFRPVSPPTPRPTSSTGHRRPNTTLSTTPPSGWQRRTQQPRQDDLRPADRSLSLPPSSDNLRLPPSVNPSLNQPQEPQVSEEAGSNDVFSVKPSLKAQHTSSSNQYRFRQGQAIVQPRLRVPQGSDAGLPSPVSPLERRRGARAEVMEPLQPTRSPSPLDGKTTQSDKSPFGIFGKNKREKPQKQNEYASSPDSGARGSSSEWLGPHRYSVMDAGRSSRLSHDSAGRMSASSDSPRRQEGPEGTQESATTAPKSIFRRGFSTVGQSAGALGNTDGRKLPHKEKSLSPPPAAMTPALDVAQSSTDSTPSSKRFSFGFLGSAIHTGRSVRNSSDDADDTPVAVMSTPPSPAAPDEPRLSQNSVQIPTEGDAKEVGKTPGKAKSRPATAGSRTVSAKSSVEGSGKTGLGALLSKAATSIFIPSPSGYQSQPSLFGAAATGFPVSPPPSRANARPPQSQATSPAQPPMASELVPQATALAPSAPPLQTSRNRSTSNLRLFGRSVSKASVLSSSATGESQPSQVVEAKKSKGGDRSNGSGSRILAPSMIQAFAFGPPPADAAPPLSSASTTTLPNSRMTRSLSKRRPATGPETTSTNGNEGWKSNNASRLSLITTTDATEDGRTLNASMTSLTASISGTRPATAGSIPLDTSRLGASGGAAALFGPASDSRTRANSKAGRSIFGGGSGSSTGGTNWLTPRKKSHSDFDTVSASLKPALERKHSDFSVISPAQSRTEDLGDLVGQFPAPASAVVHDKPKVARQPPLPSESPQEYCERLEKTINPGDIVTVLATSGEPFYIAALRCHMRRFLFVGNPLDIALRKLLMDACLPKETQQIDRVMEAFAKRYNECNEGLFASEDQPYILAFSLMMLHTDAFNKNAKKKMTKADYVRNSSSSGVAQDILEYLYDNLTFTQFIYFDDIDDQLSQSRPAVSSAPATSSSSGFLARGTGATPSYGKIDVYSMIKQGRLSEFQPWIEHLIPEDDPYSWMGTDDDFDVTTLTESYLASPSIEIGALRRPQLVASPSSQNGHVESPVAMEDEPSVTLRIFKVGIINRKDDVTEKGKRQSRKWRSCGVILSSSQLLFFRDLVWIDALKAQIAEQVAAASLEDRKFGIVISPRIKDLKPDDVLSLGDTVAVTDDTYDKHDNVLRLLIQQGSTQQSEYLFQAKNEDDMNDWVAAINFCSCFRAASLKVSDLDVASFDMDARLESERSNNTALSPLTPTLSPTDERQSASTDKRARIGAQLLSRLDGRRQELLPCLETFTKTLSEYAKELAELLRLAKHFAIMTPFQRATKDKIEAAAVPLAARIRQLRIVVAKYESRRFILVSQLQAVEEQQRSLVGRQDGVGLNGWSFSSGEKGSSAGLPFPSSTSSPTFNRVPSTSASSSYSGWQGGKIAQGRKNSWFSQSASDLNGSTPQLDSVAGGSTPQGRPSLPRHTRLASGSEASEEASSPQKGIGSFVSSNQDREYAASIISTSSRTRTSRKGSAASGLARRNGGDITESWEATKAWRDPDRIHIAQLPDLKSIEAATRRKAIQRAGVDPSSVTNNEEWEATAVVRIPSSASRKLRKASEGSVSSDVPKVPRSASVSSGSGSYVLPHKAPDPPAFMSTWGL